MQNAIDTTFGTNAAAGRAFYDKLTPDPRRGSVLLQAATDPGSVIRRSRPDAVLLAFERCTLGLDGDVDGGAGCALGV